MTLRSAKTFHRLVILGVLATACGDSGGPPGGGGDGSERPVEGDPGTVLGTGATGFEALGSGDELPLLAGPQGGYHFIVNARITGLLPGDPTMPGQLGNPQTWFSAYLGEQRIDPDLPPYRLGYRDIDDQYELPSGRLLRIDEAQMDDLIPAIYGQTVRIVVRVQDAAGTEVEDEREITAIEDPDAEDMDGGV